MGWLHKLRAMLDRQRDQRPRLAVETGASRTVLLEDRLCLGMADTFSPAAPDDPAIVLSTGISDVGSGAGTGVVSTSSAPANVQGQQIKASQERVKVALSGDALQRATRQPTDAGILPQTLPSALYSAPAADSSLATAAAGASTKSSWRDPVGTGRFGDLQSTPAVDDSTPVRQSRGPAVADGRLQDAAEGTLVQRGATTEVAVTDIPWFDAQSQPVEIRYDFRDQAGIANQITVAQQQVVERVLQAWTDASGGRIRWVRDVDSSSDQIVNIGVGDLSAVGMTSASQGTLGVGGGALSGEQIPIGLVWLDQAEAWDNEIGNGDPAGTVDFFTVMAHETGHVIGLPDERNAIMNSFYTRERALSDIPGAFKNALFLPLAGEDGTGTTGYPLHSLVFGPPQLTAGEVQDILDRASGVSAREDAIIAVVDRMGRILGVRAEADVLATFAGDPAGLAFAIDGAVAKARTAAFFANGDPTNVDEFTPGGTFAPITSRLVRFISQSTVTQREVQSNPNITDPNSTERGPGFVAPIGLGGHFPPDIPHTPPVDLFGIEHTNRDSLMSPGPDRIKGTGDDIPLLGRFNTDQTNPLVVPASQQIDPPLSFGETVGIPGAVQSRGIATLPGGIPIFRDTDMDGIGDTLIGGIGVFFPGPDGYADFEQGFDPNKRKQNSEDRTNAPLVLEAEATALFAIGGSQQAEDRGARGAKATAPIAGIAPVADLDLPFPDLSLVGINLQALGPTAGIRGARQLLKFGRRNITPGAVSGALQDLDGGAPVVLSRQGAAVPDGHLITPQPSADLSVVELNQIINAGMEAAEKTRAAIRVNAENGNPGARARMVFAITDLDGNVLALYRMQDATVFSIDVAVAKARNVAYYSDPTAPLQPSEDLGLPDGTAVTNRTFRFVAEPFFPDGVDRTGGGPWSILNNPNIDPRTGKNIGPPAPASSFDDTVLGYDAFHPGTNFQDPNNLENQNGIVFFPGSTPLYKNGVLVGGLGVSGDGVDQDDVVTFLAAQGFLPDGITVGRADQFRIRDVRLPYMKFNRNPFA